MTFVFSTLRDGTATGCGPFSHFPPSNEDEEELMTSSVLVRFGMEGGIGVRRSVVEDDDDALGGFRCLGHVSSKEAVGQRTKILTSPETVRRFETGDYETMFDTRLEWLILTLGSRYRERNDMVFQSVMSSILQAINAAETRGLEDFQSVAFIPSIGARFSLVLFPESINTTTAPINVEAFQYIFNWIEWYFTDYQLEWYYTVVDEKCFDRPEVFEFKNQITSPRMPKYFDWRRRCKAGVSEAVFFILNEVKNPGAVKDRDLFLETRNSIPLAMRRISLFTD